MTRSQSYVEYWHNGPKNTAQSDTEELSAGSVFMNLNIYSTGKLCTQKVCFH